MPPPNNLECGCGGGRRARVRNGRKQAGVVASVALVWPLSFLYSIVIEYLYDERVHGQMQQGDRCNEEEF